MDRWELQSQACPSAALCKHTLNSSTFSHCLRGWLKRTMSGRSSKQQQTPPRSSIKHHFFHEHQSLKTSSSTHLFFHQSPQLLFPDTEPELQQWQVKYWDDELHLVFVGVTWHDTFIRRKVRNTKQGHVFMTKFYYIIYELQEIHSFIQHLLTLTWYKPNQNPLESVKVSNVANQLTWQAHVQL